MTSNTGRGMTSLYADLLEPKAANEASKPSTIQKPQVAHPANEAVGIPAETPGGSDALASAKKFSQVTALRFQPIPRRPQPVQQKGPRKPAITAFAKPVKSENNSDQHDSTSGLPARAPVLVKSSLEDWATNGDDDDVNGFYNNNSRQRGGRKRRKKNKDKDVEKSLHTWDDIYDPTRPNLYEEYKDSEEKDQEVRDWRDRLYGRRRAFSTDDSEGEGPVAPRPAGFAPPNFNFAPPPSLSQPTEYKSRDEPAPMLDAETGEEIWMLRARMSQQIPPPPAFDADSPQKTFHPSFTDSEAPPPPKLSGSKPTDEKPLLSTTLRTQSFQPSYNQDAVVSRAPILYNLPPAPEEFPSEEQFAQAVEDNNGSDDVESAEEDAGIRSTRPGQKGFAERLMSKYGWTKGTGLGANSSGMVHALQVKSAKGKEKKGVGKILDRNTKRADEESKFGAMSEVVVLHRMVDGLEGEDPGVLMQEIGDECSEKYGRIERVHIVHKQSEEETSKVFVQFTSQLSALRAVNALEGRMFNGNTIKARFFDAEEFESQRLV